MYSSPLLYLLFFFVPIYRVHLFLFFLCFPSVLPPAFPPSLPSITTPRSLHYFFLFSPSVLPSFSPLPLPCPPSPTLFPPTPSQPYLTHPQSLLPSLPHHLVSPTYERLPLAAIQGRHLNRLGRCVQPVQELPGVIDGQSVGPLQVCVHQDSPRLPIHASAFYLGALPPVSPEHEASCRGCFCFSADV